MRSLLNLVFLLTAVAAQAPVCEEDCADVYAVATTVCPRVGNTKEDAESLDGPKMNWKNDIWSTRGRDSAVVEINPDECTLRTFAGRGDFCGVWINGKTEEGPKGSEVKQQKALYQIPFNGGCCKIDHNLCKNIDWAQLLRVKKGPTLD
ncbi:hypothetical protein C8034_v009128 [Colletotrichum sidae]|uniref:Ecp2 effector protein domain-containing protein n=1 Tax=Colletotrichum sidae TaxID=1347389 RepID=A0A4R8TGY2_9PEZI|nr:hypothetical protein C8034_v009128 [Colletotrichum sidae]